MAYSRSHTCCRSSTSTLQIELPPLPTHTYRLPRDKQSSPGGKLYHPARINRNHLSIGSPAAIFFTITTCIISIFFFHLLFIITFTMSNPQHQPPPTPFPTNDAVALASVALPAPASPLKAVRLSYADVADPGKRSAILHATPEKG